ncbi:MAG: ABC-type transport system involved in cytochrome c biosis, permease component [Bacteroidota bacterium]|jgi:heme exporter protein C|nr:ABC-type transport system involved in cytochrome c biosis, permease component [Bacteroidota bacterium]
MKNYWWKILAAALVLYTIVAGFLLSVPAQPILHETIRNLYFHVPMWFGMMTILFISLWHSIKYLSKSDIQSDIVASQAAHTGMLLGFLGIVTGSVWAKYTWGAWWVSDTKLNGAAITLLIYLAYFILRGSLDEEQKRARISAVYNIFAYVMLIVFLMILPRLNDSLHPGNGGNPGFNKYDLDSTMRMVFYPAVAGWILLGVWMMTIKVRIEKLKRKILMNE